MKGIRKASHTPRHECTALFQTPWSISLALWLTLQKSSNLLLVVFITSDTRWHLSHLYYSPSSFHSLLLQSLRYHLWCFHITRNLTRSRSVHVHWHDIQTFPCGTGRNLPNQNWTSVVHAPATTALYWMERHF